MALRPAANPFQALAEGANMLAAGVQTQAQAFMNAHAQVLANFSRAAQQAQTNFQRGLNEFIAGTGATAAKPMLAVQELAKGGGFTPTKWFEDESTEAVRARAKEKKEFGAPLSKASAEVPYTQPPNVAAGVGFAASPSPKPFRKMKVAFF